MHYKSNNDQGVSPVIGVILMVAITVILAAVIAAFVFGMAGNIQKSKTVAATVSKASQSAIDVTYQGGQDASSLSSLAVTITPGTGATIAGVATTADVTGTISSTVGSSEKFTIGTGAATDSFGVNAHVVVVGIWTDNTRSVVLDTYI